MWYVDLKFAMKTKQKINKNYCFHCLLCLRVQPTQILCVQTKSNGKKTPFLGMQYAEPKKGCTQYAGLKKKSRRTKYTAVINNYSVLSAC